MWTEIVIVNVLLSKQMCSIIGRECNGYKADNPKELKWYERNKACQCCNESKRKCHMWNRKKCLLHYKMIRKKKEKKKKGHWCAEMKWRFKVVK